jgi:Tfp pilus assembly protein PilO
MTARDRIVLMAITVVAVLGGAWMLVVSPERKQASKLDAEVGQVRTRLQAAEAQVASARAAQAQYSVAYASIVSLGKAVPPAQEVPSLIYELDRASNQKQVNFSSIVSAGSGSGASPSATPSAPSSPSASGPSTSATGFTQMPFTFVFNGTYKDLYNLFAQLNRFTMRTPTGALQVKGRLLTVQAIKLAPVVANEGTSEKLTGTITATAYVLPAAQGLTGGATPALPTGGATQPAAAAGAPSSPTAPAIVRLNP